jgi:phage terminase small subunit
MGKGVLTAKQQRFVDEYLLDLNATAAYKRAGYAPKDADVAGPRLLGNVGIAAAVAAAIAARSARTLVATDRVLREHARMAFVNVRDLFTPDLQLVPLRELAEDDSAAIVGLKVKRTATSTTNEKGHTVDTVVTTADVKLEKHGALTTLARHLGIDKLTVADERLDLTRLSTETLKRIRKELGLS